MTLAAGCALRERAEDRPLGVLAAQQDAWNRGDLQAFMEGYHRSADTTFSSAGKTDRGWDTVLASYRKRYPDRAAMGKLTFSELVESPLGDAASLVRGRFRLVREGSAREGIFSVVFVRFPEGWRIIHDHTSALAP